MKFSHIFACTALTIGLGLPLSADAGKKEPKNLKVITYNGKSFKKGMKLMTKGLGVKCKACHVKGKFESDEVAAKVSARAFFDSTVGKKDAAARKAALTKLLASMKLDAPKDEAKVWSGVDLLERK